jgi:polysaccharide pyruvyl transferase WcaK-like protein
VSQSNRKDRICLAGCSLDTSNLGVSALAISTACHLSAAFPGNTVTLLDHGRGIRSAAVQLDGDAPLQLELCGAKRTKRVYLPESYAQIRLAARVLPAVNHAATRLKHAAAICDISGGDSFTDLYGPWRYKAVTEAKRLAIAHRVPLVLLPQTYGPFKDPALRDDAARLCRGAAQAWARDARSFEILKDLLGDAFDPHRHRLGVDVAFLLPKAEPPEAKLGPALARALEDSRPRLGVNISGLIYNDPAAARDRYGFKADYRELATGLVRWLLERDEGDVVLVPHVLAPPGVAESDPAANEAVARELAGVLPPGMVERLHVLPPVLDAGQTKWVVSRCSWFCGTRMHATIAGLSSGVCTATINYSDKARGVFEGCHMGEAVVDPRKLDTDESLGAIQSVYLRREEFGRTLAEGLPPVLRTAEWQMDEIAGCIRWLEDGPNQRQEQ